MALDNVLPSTWNIPRRKLPETRDLQRQKLLWSSGFMV